MNQDLTSRGGRDRGQTAQDFAVGIGLFLLAVAFVFAFVPQVVSPYDVGVGASESAQADRAASLIVGNLSVEDRPNELHASRTTTYFNGADVDALRNRTGLPFTARINVTVRNVASDDLVWSGGAMHREGRATAAATRIVRTNEPGTCDPACRMTVRVW
ncbi:hypothetical protein L593_13590 [Salinarchaeum sp. Harcht-Bsk1]|uniref:DUF7287 family protein n=1 Tax=Salinarchaeum sp. Harcht-Bsk1 TaxID=1333523 RepID=UPI0003423F1C|nr:hypothetical protein [Salinarchaeum sp. Harcht-Bsk1]AGN02657.1 hypothetical protein L593_13590 [Salinarchaeum sp. Harcht-Bsk1]